jgi:hypothetical protein
MRTVVEADHVRCDLAQHGPEIGGAVDDDRVGVARSELEGPTPGGVADEDHLVPSRQRVGPAQDDLFEPAAPAIECAEVGAYDGDAHPVTLMPPPPDDPTLARRARIARLTEVGQLVGYGLFALAIVAFVIGAATGFATADVVIVVACLAAGSAVLAPAIVFGYAVKAAEREDRQRAAAPRPDRG